MNRRKLIKILSCILAVLIVGAGGVFFAAYQRLKNISPDILLDNDGELGSSKPKTYVTYKGERYYYNDNLVTLMLIGIDQSEAEGREGLGARSDTMVVCAVDVVENTIKMIVCPRDSKALIRHIDTDGNVYKEDYNKLNSSFPYGGGNQDRNKGAENVVYCVKRLLSCDGKYDIPLEKYGGINMDGVGPLNDAVGGVTVTLKESVTGVGKEGETVKLTGDQAFTFCIQRKIEGMDGSDISRGQRQMQFLMGLAKAIKDMQVTQIPSIYSSMTKYVFTNLSTDEMVAYAKILKNINLDTMQQTQIAGTSGSVGGGSGWILDEEALEQTVIDTFYIKDPDQTGVTVTPEPSETATPSPTETTKKTTSPKKTTKKTSAPRKTTKKTATPKPTQKKTATPRPTTTHSATQRPTGTNQGDE